MRSTSLLLVLAAAGAIAHPSLRRSHVHHMSKRGDDPALLKAWNEDGVHHEEYVVYETVVLPSGADEPAAAPVSSTPPAAKSPVTSVAAAVASTPAPAPAPKVEIHQAALPAAPPAASPAPVVPQAPAAPANSPSSDSSSTPSSSGSCSVPSVNGGDASAWANNPCSGGKSILDSFNTMRANWIPSLANSKYTWDATLAANARLTATLPVSVGSSGQKINEGGATEMNHNLLPGSMAQTIASGDSSTMAGNLTPFEQAAKMWLCEEPQGNIGCTGGPSSDTGHAEIIKSTTYTKVGCYYMDATGPASWKGEWTCDFA